MSFQQRRSSDPNEPGPIGVIGGMGPLATADFLQKVIEEAHAETDRDHVPLLISCDPRIPERPAAILAGGASPLPRLLEIRDMLVAAGASALVMPCNTAHRWYADLVADCPVPFLDIVEVGCREVLRLARPGAAIGIAGTQATLASKLFDRKLAQHGLTALQPTAGEIETLLLPAIAHVKAGRLAAAAPLAVGVIDALARRGARFVLLACTELPLAVAATAGAVAAPCIDTTRTLARATVEQWRSQAGRPAGAAGSAIAGRAVEADPRDGGEAIVR